MEEFGPKLSLKPVILYSVFLYSAWNINWKTDYIQNKRDSIQGERALALRLSNHTRYNTHETII